MIAQNDAPPVQPEPTQEELETMANEALHKATCGFLAVGLRGMEPERRKIVTEAIESGLWHIEVMTKVAAQRGAVIVHLVPVKMPEARIELYRVEGAGDSGNAPVDEMLELARGSGEPAVTAGFPSSGGSRRGKRIMH